MVDTSLLFKILPPFLSPLLSSSQDVLLFLRLLLALLKVKKQGRLCGGTSSKNLEQNWPGHILPSAPVKEAPPAEMLLSFLLWLSHEAVTEHSAPPSCGWWEKDTFPSITPSNSAVGALLIHGHGLQWEKYNHPLLPLHLPLYQSAANELTMLSS